MDGMEWGENGIENYKEVFMPKEESMSEFEFLMMKITGKHDEKVDWAFFPIHAG